MARINERHGGPRPNSGRKSKAEEMGLAALLDKCWTKAEREKCIQMLAKKALAGEMEAVKLLMSYTFGTPKATVDLNHGGSITNYQIEIGGAERSSADSETQYIN